MGYPCGIICKPKLLSATLMILFFLLCITAGCSAGSGPAAPSEEVIDQGNLPVDSDHDSTSPISPITSDNSSTVSGSGVLRVHFLDVGQADAILVQLPNRQVMLIDAGNNSDGPFVVDYLNNAGIKKIDYLVGSHPHEDHIGGLDNVINSFDIGKVILPAKEHTTQTFKDVLLAIQDKGLRITKAEAGKPLLNDNGLSVNILAPVGTSYDDLNNYSAVIKVTFEKTSFLFTGDAENLSEQEMLAGGFDLKADVLKVGHHGSSSSTSQAFLDAVDPAYALIDVGADNDYGHPHQKTLDKLQKAGVKVYRTDIEGTIIFTSDGNKIAVSHSALGHP